MGGGDGSERRTSQRVELFLKVVYPEGSDPRRDYISNLGEGGMLLHTSLPLEPGEQISFSLEFPELAEPLQLKGLVRWRREPDPEAPEEAAGLGVQFLFESEEQRDRIEGLVRPLGEARPGGSARQGAFRVLVVEDNDHMLDLFVYAVRRFHHEKIGEGELEVLCATSGEEALQKAGSGRGLDMAVVDQRLPDMNGDRLVAALRQASAGEDLPIVAIGGVAAEDRRKALASGADAFLSKPVQNRELMSAMASLLARERSAE